MHFNIINKEIVNTTDLIEVEHNENITKITKSKNKIYQALRIEFCDDLYNAFHMTFKT